MVVLFIKLHSLIPSKSIFKSCILLAWKLPFFISFFSTWGMPCTKYLNKMWSDAWTCCFHSLFQVIDLRPVLLSCSQSCWDHWHGWAHSAELSSETSPALMGSVCTQEPSNYKWWTSQVTLTFRWVSATIHPTPGSQKVGSHQCPWTSALEVIQRWETMTNKFLQGDPCLLMIIKELHLIEPSLGALCLLLDSEIFCFPNIKG